MLEKIRRTATGVVIDRMVRMLSRYLDHNVPIIVIVEHFCHLSPVKIFNSSPYGNKMVELIILMIKKW